MTKGYYPEGQTITTLKNKQSLLTASNIVDAHLHGDILEAPATVCDYSHNLLVNLGAMDGIIPREEGAIGIAEGTVRDIALISRVGKPVSFVITGFKTDSYGKQLALLSRRKAQEECVLNYISRLSPGDIIPARVTHLENFGAFCDIGCGMIALLPIDSISVSRISHPRDRFKPGDFIKVIVKSIDDGKITLTMKELLGSWEQNSQCFTQGETVSGIIRSVENYGVFVELAPNLAGLAEPRLDAKVGNWASVYIKSVLPNKMKVKLIVIDTFEDNETTIPLKYFHTKNHIDSWCYSPSCCEKYVGTEFPTLL